MITKTNGYTPLPNLENHKCFGCSPNNPSGLRMTFFSKNDTLYSWVKVPSHLCGWDNLAHGGVISAMLDEIMGRSAMYHLKTLVLTKSLTIDFLRPIYIGEELRIEGRALSIKNEREAIFEGSIFNDKEKLCAKSKGTFVLFHPDALRKKGVIDEALINDLEKLVCL